MNDFEALISPSPKLGLIYGICQFLVWLQLVLLNIDATYQIMGFLLCLGHGMWTWLWHLWSNNPHSCKRLKYQNGHFYVLSKNNWQAIKISARTVVFAHLIMLKFQTSKRFISHTLYLVNDNLPPDIHRKLRVILKFKQLA